MGTRTNIKLRVEGRELYLYRHWDGYLGETGAHVLEVAKQVKRRGLGNVTVTDVANLFLKECYAADGTQPARPVYELTDCIHGDIEHYYVIVVVGGIIRINHAERKNYDDDVDTWTRRPKQYTLETFAALVNNDREKMNAHVRETWKQDWYRNAKLKEGITEPEQYALVTAE